MEGPIFNEIRLLQESFDVMNFHGRRYREVEIEPHAHAIAQESVDKKLYIIISLISPLQYPYFLNNPSFTNPTFSKTL